MDLKTSFGSRKHRGFFLLGYIALLSTIWFLASFTLGAVTHDQHFEIVLIWAIASGITSVAVLDLINFFDPVHLLPRKRDLLTLCSVLPFPGMFWKLVLFATTGVTVVRYNQILLVTPLAAVVAYVYHVAARALSNRSKKGPYRLLAALTPAEIERLRRSFKGLPIENRLQVVPWNIKVGRDKSIDWIVYSRQILRDLRSDAPIIEAIFSGVPAVEFRRLLMVLDFKADLSLIDTWYFLQIQRDRGFGSKLYEFTKQVWEPFVAGVALLIGAPFLIMVGIFIRLESPGPMFYSQVRAGRRGKPFRLLKFRTMVVDAEKSGVQWSSENDNRITPLGRFLRKTRIDELPQLVNVLRGELGFVGPRPERPEIVRRLENDLPFFSLRTIIRPGITGWAQVQYGYVASVEESRLKLEYDLFYIVHQSVWLDLAILLKTLALILRGGGTGR